MNKKFCEKNAYAEYDNFQALEVPCTDAIPGDYNGIIGVPISFIEKYNPDQFEILGIDSDVKDDKLNHLKKHPGMANWIGAIWITNVFIPEFL